MSFQKFAILLSKHKEKSYIWSLVLYCSLFLLSLQWMKCIFSSHTCFQWVAIYPYWCTCFMFYFKQRGRWVLHSCELFLLESEYPSPCVSSVYCFCAKQWVLCKRKGIYRQINASIRSFKSTTSLQVSQSLDLVLTDQSALL